MSNVAESRFENIVQSIIDGTPYEHTAESREEELLLELKEVIEEGGGGGGGGADVRALTAAEEAEIIGYLDPTIEDPNPPIEDPNPPIEDPGGGK